MKIPVAIVTGIILLTYGGGAAPSALAQDDESPISLSANVAIVTDYRFRGISLSDNDAAIQGGLDLSTSVGFYVGAWASSIDEFAGSEIELDVYAGFDRDVAGFTLGVSVTGYTFPGGTDVNYYEFGASVGRSVADVDLAAGIAYAPSQANLGDVDSTYIYGTADYAIGETPFALSGLISFEDGAFGANKVYWLIGASYSYKQFTLQVQYIGADQTGGGLDDTVLASIGAEF